MKNLVYILLLFLLAAKCNSGSTNMEGLKLSDSYNQCEPVEHDYGTMITIGDPNNKFMIRLPYSWDIQESYSDTLYGLIASNREEAGDDPAKLVLVSVTGYQTNDSVQEYFRKEIRSLKKDRKMKPLEGGPINFNGQDAYWVLFESKESDQKMMNIVLYIQSVGRNEIYLLQSSVYMTDNYMDRLCDLKQLVNSFELE